MNIIIWLAKGGLPPSPPLKSTTGDDMSTDFLIKNFFCCINYVFETKF